MTKYEKICKKEGLHCWNMQEAGIDVADEDFDNIELEIVCDRCGSSVYLSGTFDGAPENWKPRWEKYWKRISKERKEDKEYMIREAEKRKKE